MTFTENDKELIRWYRREIEKSGIEVHLNTEVNDLGTLRGYDDTVSYTHLDVYKRQSPYRSASMPLQCAGGRML